VRQIRTETTGRKPIRAAPFIVAKKVEANMIGRRSHFVNSRVPLAVLAIAAVALSACSSAKTAKAAVVTGSGGTGAAVAPETSNVTVTWSAGSGATAPLWLAADQGIFAKHGLNVKVVQSGSTVGATAVIAGSAQFFYGEATSAFQAVAQGSPVEIVGTLRNLNVFKFYVTPNITSPADLKGKSLAISSVGDSTDLSTRSALATLGVPESSVTLLPTGTSTLRLTAMVTGHVAGTLLTEPTASQAAKQGMKLILDQTTKPFAGSAISISKSFGQKNPNTVIAFMESLEEGVKYLDDPANKTQVLQVMAKYLAAKPTDSAVTLQYDSYSPAGALAHDPYPDVAAGNAVIQALQSEDPTRFGKLTLNQVYDDSFATTVRNSGFLTATWGAAASSPAGSPAPS
jgi:NitT/TauT family transport system substrate-binding protein